MLGQGVDRAAYVLPNGAEQDKGQLVQILKQTEAEQLWVSADVEGAVVWEHAAHQIRLRALLVRDQCEAWHAQKQGESAVHIHKEGYPEDLENAGQQDRIWHKFFLRWLLKCQKNEQ